MNQPYSPEVPKAGQLTYGSYLEVNALLSLQKPESSPPHHDEMLFIIIHQAYELWFKLILHELDTTIEFMAQKKILRAQHFLKRVVEIQKLLVQQIHILETMTPMEFLAFRDRLNPASGFQSHQFREVEFIAGLKNKAYLKFFENEPEAKAKLEKRLNGPDLASSYKALLKSTGYSVDTEESFRQSLIEIYSNLEKDLPLYLLSETLVDFDQHLMTWREHHVKVVERLIGFKKGTGGSTGAEYLRSTLGQKAFPFLWEIRADLKKG